MKKFGEFLKKFFTTNIPVKLLAVGLALVTVFLINIQ
jgi:hypothetical protein